MIEQANGAAIKVIRERSGISQRDLALRIGVSNALISRIESGASGASPETLRKLADALHCPREAIVGYTAPEPETAAASAT